MFQAAVHEALKKQTALLKEAGAARATGGPGSDVGCSAAAAYPPRRQGGEPAPAHSATATRCHPAEARAASALTASAKLSDALTDLLNEEVLEVR